MTTVLDEKQSAQVNKYQSLAGDYDKVFGREDANHFYKIESIGNLLFEHMPPSPRYDILEAGAGTGIHASSLLQQYGARIRKLTLSDISKEMLAQAKQRLARFDNVDYCALPAELLPDTAKYHGIYVSGAMHHFSDPFKAIDVMRDRLVPGGMLVICEPNVLNPLNFVKAAKEREEWGQFVVRRRPIHDFLASRGFEIVCNRVLHWRAGNPLGRRLWPYARLEKHRIADSLAVMFLLGARKLS